MPRGRVCWVIAIAADREGWNILFERIIQKGHWKIAEQNLWNYLNTIFEKSLHKLQTPWTIFEKKSWSNIFENESLKIIIEQNLGKTHCSNRWTKSLNEIIEHNLRKSLKQYLSKLFDQSIWTNRWTNIEQTCWTKSLQNMWTKSLEGPLERSLWAKSLRAIAGKKLIFEKYLKQLFEKVFEQHVRWNLLGEALRKKFQNMLDVRL